MGIFSAIGGAISSVCSAIGGAIGSACSAIGGAFFSGAKGIGVLASTLLVPLAPTLTEILIGIQIVSKIVSVIAEALGLKKEEEKPEELGIKAEKSDKKPEDFETTEEYIKYLREEISVDKKEIENLSPEDRVKYMAMGTAITIKGIEEKYAIEAPGEFWRTVADRDLKGEEVQEYIKNFKDKGITNMKDMSDYLNGKEPESGTEKSKVSSAIVDTMKELEPELSEIELAEKFNSMIQMEG